MIRRSCLCCLVLVVLVVSVVGPCPAPASAAVSGPDEPRIDLHPRYTVGQENRFRVVMHSRTQTQFLDTPRVRLQEYEQRMRVRRKVLEAGPSGATIEVVYEAVAVTLVAGNKTITFDSEGINGAEPEEVLGPTTRNAIDRPFIIKVDADGNVLSVSGNEQNGTKMAAASLIDAEVLTHSLAPIYGLGKLPEPIAIGQEWSESRASKPDLSGVFTTTVKSRLASVTGARATIDLTGGLTLEPSKKAIDGHAQLTGQAVEGVRVWNLFEGVIDRSVYQRTMTIEADVEAIQPMQEHGTVRRREGRTLLYVAIDRIDDGVDPLPPLPPIPEATAAPVRPGAAPAEPAATTPNVIITPPDATPASGGKP